MVSPFNLAIRLLIVRIEGLETGWVGKPVFLSHFSLQSGTQRGCLAREEGLFPSQNIQTRGR
jgi:hypothetical protein